jgi:hypothetical protein
MVSIVPNDRKAAETLTAMMSGFWVVVEAPGSRILQVAKAAKSKAATKGAAISW